MIHDVIIALIHDVIRGLQRHDVPIEPLFADTRWQLVRSSAPIRSWLNVLNRNGFPCRIDDNTDLTDPVVSLTSIGQYADAERANLLALMLWLAPTLRTRRDEDLAMADRGPISWASIRLGMDRIEFNDDCLQPDVQSHGAFEITSRDGLSRIERDGQLVCIVNQGRLGLLTAECAPRGIDVEYVYESIQGWVAYVERHKKEQRLRIAPVLARSKDYTELRRYRWMLPSCGTILLSALVLGWRIL